MTQKLRRLFALVMSMTMLFGTALADSAGLDRAMAGYLEGIDEISFRLSARFDQLLPYGDGTVEMINGLLGHMSAAGSVGDGGAETRLAFLAGDEEIVSITEREGDDGTSLTTDLLPSRVLVSADSAMNALSGLEQQEIKFDFDRAVQEAEGCYRQLTDAIVPFAEEKASNYNIKNVGSARWGRIARLTPEQSAQIQPQIAMVLGCGMDDAFRAQLNDMVCQKSFVVALYQTGEGGDDLAVYIKGNVLFPDGVQRAISYQWAFGTNSKGQRVDTYKFEMTKSKAPRDNREINVTSRQLSAQDSMTVDLVSKAVIRDPETGITTTSTLTRKLSGKDGSITGTVTDVVREQEGEKAHTKTITYTPDLMLKRQENAASLTGSVKVEVAQGQNTHTSLEVLFGENAAQTVPVQADEGVSIEISTPESSLTQNLDWDLDDPEEFLVGRPPIGFTDHEAPKEETVIDLDHASEEELAALTDELVQNLSGRLLRAIAVLPDEATALVRDNMSDEDWAAFLTLLEE